MKKDPPPTKCKDTPPKKRADKKQKQIKPPSPKKSNKIVSSDSNRDSSDSSDEGGDDEESTIVSPSVSSGQVSTRSARKRQSEEDEMKSDKVTKVKENPKKPKKKVKSSKLNGTKLGLYKCTTCSYTDDDGDAFVDHSYIMHTVKLFICKIIGCVKVYTSQNGLRNHCKNIHEDVLRCTTCKLISLSPQGLEEHMLTHKDSTKQQCDGCHKTFTRTNDRDKHWRNTCPKNPNRFIKCKHCLHATGDEKASEVDVLCC